MFITDIILYNRVPFQKLHLSFEKNDIAVLAAINGKGKTTILSYIMDAWVALTRGAYPTTYKGKEYALYRVSSSLFAMDVSKTSVVYIRFCDKGVNYDYIDARGKFTEIEYDNIIPLDDKLPYNSFNTKFRNDGIIQYYDKTLNDEKVKELFENNIATYMPAYRYEMPNYLGDAYSSDVKFTTDSRYSSEMTNPLEVRTAFDDIENWFLDMVLDAYVFTKANMGVKGISPYAPENKTWENINKVLQETLSSKYPDKKLQFQLMERNSGGKRIGVMNYELRHNLIPSINSLSSGEKAVLVMFGELIRQADRIKTNVDLNDITGIVLIDEIDMHLHISLQKDVLPRLLNLFPNVQFIISSHSPFLNMGLADAKDGRTKIIDLDHGGIVSSPTNNEIYQEAYSMFLNERNNYAQELSKIKNLLESTTRPLVITEGKTDIKHILKAMTKLGIAQRFDVLTPEEQIDGDSNLKVLLNQQKLLKRSNKIIGVFDRDNDNLTKEYKDPYVSLGNGVYALRIPCPQCRIDENRTKVSIEYFYSDDEIKSSLPNADGCRLFFGNEFVKDSTKQHVSKNGLFLSTPDGLGIDKIIENNGKQAVYDSTFKNQLAKKDQFADAIEKDLIQISDQSWENFRPLIDIINQIIDL